jgi:hypothetical protein
VCELHPTIPKYGPAVGFLDVVKTMKFESFQEFFLHLSSYIERWHLHGESSNTCTNPHWINLQHSLINGALNEAIVACFMLLPLHEIGDV